ncbi:hypothetical protein CSB66_2446 [Enterobacter hormaechei]|nr:hypothetical protein CSB66_2446 [Enterobacter hormaechei]
MNTKNELLNIIESGFYNIPRNKRDEWLKQNYGFGYRAFYNRMKKYNIQIQKIVTITKD